MGKHETGYPRVARDFYPTLDRWVVTDALALHLALRDRRVWECAAGEGHMVKALKDVGAEVYATDIHEYDYPLDGLHDFLSPQRPKWRFDGIITNPPGGPRNKTAEQFIVRGLELIADGGFLALLLPVDFNSAKTRRHLFADCPLFAAKIVLNNRLVWFEHPEKKPAPKEWHAWFIWKRANPQPVLLYAFDPSKRGMK